MQQMQTTFSLITIKNLYLLCETNITFLDAAEIVQLYGQKIVLFTD